MSSKGRTNWKQRAERAEARADELEQAAEGWKALASTWRGRCHQLEDIMAQNEAALLSRTEQPGEEGDDGSSEPDG